jgi:hypothetical protein
MSVRDAYFYKINYQGDIILKKKVDTSIDGLNVYCTGDYWSMLLAYGTISGKQLLGLHMSRSMTKSYDGLNH